MEETSYAIFFSLTNYFEVILSLYDKAEQLYTLFIRLTASCKTRSSTRQTRMYYHLLQRFKLVDTEDCAETKAMYCRISAKMIGVRPRTILFTQILPNAGVIICLIDKGKTYCLFI